MIKAEYLGVGVYVGNFKHLGDNQLIITAHPYRIRQNVLKELVTNAIIGDGFPCRCREIEAVIKQLLNELPENYSTLAEQGARLCIKLSW